MKNIFLAGRSIYLSPLTVSDVSEKYIGWLNDREVCRDNSHAVIPNNEARARAYVESVQQSRTDFVFAVRMKDGDGHVGNVALQSVNWINRSGELAIIIGEKAAWGKGIGTECYRLLLDYGFKTLNLHRIYSCQTVRNAGMMKVCEKVGMKKEGVLRQSMFKENEYLDVAMYAVLRTEYEP